MSSPIIKYRAVQRRIRRLFDKYTAELCPLCPEFCCHKPTKVAEFDVLLANAHGCDLPTANESAAEMVKVGFEILTGENSEGGTLEPCDYLGPDGCLFPDDLRPYECVRFVCIYIKKALKPCEMRELRDSLHRFGVLHRELTAAVKLKK